MLCYDPLESELGAQSVWCPQLPDCWAVPPPPPSSCSAANRPDSQIATTHLAQASGVGQPAIHGAVTEFNGIYALPLLLNITNSHIIEDTLIPSFLCKKLISKDAR